MATYGTSYSSGPSGTGYSGTGWSGSGYSSYGSPSSGSSGSPSSSNRGVISGASGPSATIREREEQKAAADAREAQFQQQQAAARQPTGQQTAEQIAESQKYAGYGGQFGSVAGGIAGAALGPLGSLAGKFVGGKLGSQLGGQAGGVIGPNPVIGGGYDVSGAQTFQPGGAPIGGTTPTNKFSAAQGEMAFGTGPGTSGSPVGGGFGQFGGAIPPTFQTGGSGIGGAVSAEVAGQQAGIEEQRRMLEQTQAGLSPYQQAGAGALEQQQALTGLLGAEAQKAAYDAINVSPGQKFLRDRQEKALLRSAAATGGLGGGNVLTGLQQQAMGFAQQDIENQFGRLGSLTDRGYGATVAGGQFGSGAAANIANLQSASGEARASGIIGQQALDAQKAEGIANMVGMFAEPLGNIAGDIWSGVTESWEW